MRREGPIFPRDYARLLALEEKMCFREWEEEDG